MLYLSEGELLNRFGFEVVPISLVEIIEAMNARLSGADSEVGRVVEQFRDTADFSEISDQDVRKMAALKLAIQEWAAQKQLSAVAIQCWSALQIATGIMPCFVNAVLTDEGLPMACETDIHGAITASMLYAAGMRTQPVFFADLTIRHPENDTPALALWPLRLR